MKKINKYYIFSKYIRKTNVEQDTTCHRISNDIRNCCYIIIQIHLHEVPAVLTYRDVILFPGYLLS